MSDPQTLLLHLDPSPRTVERVRLARHLAETFDAQVSGVYAVVPWLARQAPAGRAPAVALAALQALDDEAREAARQAFVAASAAAPRLHWAPPCADPFWAFTRRALYADLVVVGQRDPDDASAGLQADFVPNLITESGRPTLVVPYAGPVPAVGRCVLVAWKETREAARALAAAWPWLRRAEQVHLVSYGATADVELADLRQRLAERGIAAQVHHGGPDGRDTGERLLSQAADVGADLLVMGAYGHSRAREWVLGGVTRTVLSSLTVPVLMVH